MGDAFIKLLQSSLVADLVAVAATAALAALAEHGFTSRGAGDDRRRGQRAGKAVKEAGKAAAAAVGRRLSNEIEEMQGGRSLRAAQERKPGAADVARALLKPGRVDRFAAGGLDAHPAARREPVGVEHRLDGGGS